MIDLNKAATVFIGRRGENHFRKLEFDVSSLLGDEYPGEALTALYKRPDGAAYPVATSYAEGVLTWSPGAADTEITGVGRLEIRVTQEDVVGKSARVLTVVEDALADGIAEPPEPPAQEWLNRVLPALAALDANDAYALLNLMYNQMGSMRDTLYTRTGIILNHLHPVETASAPDMASRRASITFTAVSPGSSMALGGVTYTFVTALGSPATNTAQVLIQSNLSDTVKKLAEAIRGVPDTANIAYGGGTNPHPACTGYWTKQRFSIGDISVAPGESLFLLEKAEDATAALPLTSTAAATINAFARAVYMRYVMSGNVSGSGGANSVRGPLHTVLPIGSVVIGGQDDPLIPVPYDCHLVTICRQSDTSEKELDFYISNDEQNFIRISRSTPLSSDSTAEAQHVQIAMKQRRVPAGYGLYVRIGSNGTSATAYCDLKFTCHLYPAALAADI